MYDVEVVHCREAKVPSHDLAQLALGAVGTRAVTAVPFENLRYRLPPGGAPSPSNHASHRLPES